MAPGLRDIPLVPTLESEVQLPNQVRVRDISKPPPRSRHLFGTRLNEGEIGRQASKRPVGEPETLELERQPVPLVDPAGPDGGGEVGAYIAATAAADLVEDFASWRVRTRFSTDGGATWEEAE